MFKIFKRRKDKPAVTYSVMQKFGEMAERKQRLIAAYLNNKTKKFSKRKWIWLLAGFCTVFIAASVEILLDSFRDKKHPAATQPAGITVPKFIGHQDNTADSMEAFEQ